MLFKVTQVIFKVNTDIKAGSVHIRNNMFVLSFLFLLFSFLQCVLLARHATFPLRRAKRACARETVNLFAKETT